VMSAISEYVSSFQRTEDELNAWGYQCRMLSARLGLPTSSNGIVRMIDEVREFERKRRDVRDSRKKGDAVVVPRPQKCAKCQHITTRPECPRCAGDVKAVAIDLGLADATLTAEGKETRGNGRPELQLSGGIARVDKVVGGLPGWMKAAIHRSYLWQQPDRIAARELKMSRAEFTRRREASVEYVADRLALARSASV
jgi:hypothetical protein